jgi:putative ABC transport system ATP-binding protein
MSEHGIRAHGLARSFGRGSTEVHAIRGVDLDVEPGEVVLIMGPSGSGKTTLLSMLGAMLRPTAGTVRVDGIDLTAMPESRLPAFRARHFGFVFQDFNLLGALSVRENVEFALNLGGMHGGTARRRAEQLLGDLGLGDRLGFRPYKLSGGEKQRVAIARAIANEPPVILADEPTANLDSKIGHETARLLRHAASHQHRSVVIVSHDTRLKDIADRMLWLEDGQFTAMSQLATDPVCGMTVEREHTPHYRHRGRTWYFCSPTCRDEFTTDPDRFVHTHGAAEPPETRSISPSGGPLPTWDRDLGRSPLPPGVMARRVEERTRQPNQEV